LPSIVTARLFRRDLPQSGQVWRTELSDLLPVGFILMCAAWRQEVVATPSKLPLGVGLAGLMSGKWREPWILRTEKEVSRRFAPLRGSVAEVERESVMLDAAQLE
jgi:hypothetical protein